MLQNLETQGWNYLPGKSCIVLVAPDRSAANEMIEYAYEWLKAIANVWGEVVIRWKGCRRGFKVKAEKSALQADSIKQIIEVQQVFGTALTGIHKPLIKVLERMVDSKYPMSLVRMSDDRQLWVNSPMVQLLETTPAEATERILTDFWLPGDLENLKQKVLQCDARTGFDHRYEAGFSPKTWARLYAHFDRIDDGGYRLATTYEWTPVPHPVLSK
ncbi:PAS domain-containing protein [Okeania sp. KiyG1]|uniref:PAS domain-containing protein n=1 Tax=Okeania sp. KiyG1 TaxID=2720165 RepID=UPI001921F1B8|nr:PAS domain-containing protein [Okeania sp. KiyG1]GGA46357.1 hypothetical protein CYANOKiyG1_65380 [Okeania sp. KiyG1]